jgi:hypothetical protein
MFAATRSMAIFPNGTSLPSQYALYVLSSDVQWRYLDVSSGHLYGQYVFRNATTS